MQTTPDADRRTLETALFSRRHKPGGIPIVAAPGLYALFLAEPAVLPQIAIPASGLIYIGMTGTSLELRNHFTHKQSGFSTVRRSLGALLKDELQLRALPRAPGPSKTNVTSYRFDDPGESRLSDWMNAHLAYGFVQTSADLEDVERFLILEREPPLNLTSWRNPQRKMVKELRGRCIAEARQASSRAAAIA